MQIFIRKTEDFIEKYTYHLILFSGALFFFHHLSQLGFFMDGLIYAALGKNMALSGNWLVPHMSDTMYSTFHDHIPFMLILEGMFFKIMGSSFFSARLFINLFTFLTFYFFVKFLSKNTNRIQTIIGSFLFLLSLPMMKHTRHPNFDMPLMLMCFLSINFYIKALDDSLKRNWYLSGITFGLAMLFKGPMAIFIPLTIVIHLIFSKNLSQLKKITPWLSLILGLLIFLIWPLSMFLGGHIDVFLEWFKFTIIASIYGSRGVIENDYLVYAKHLLLFTPLNVFLGFWSFWKLKNEKFSNFYSVHLVFVFVVLILTSMMKYKLSHYVMTIYPALAVIGCLGITKANNKKVETLIVLFIFCAGVFVFFTPQDSKKNRDFEIFEIQNLLLEKKLSPTSYVVEKNAYPYWSLSALMSFLNGINVYEVNSADLKLEKKNSLYFLLSNEHSDIKYKCQLLYELKNYQSQAYYCP